VHEENFAPPPSRLLERFLQELSLPHSALSPAVIFLTRVLPVVGGYLRPDNNLQTLLDPGLAETGWSIGAYRQGMLVVELTRGPNWQEPVEVIDRRECHTDSVSFAMAEARFWLNQRNRIEPHRGATHYRILDQQGEIVAGGPP
jgi:hypothetical protein